MKKLIKQWGVPLAMVGGVVIYYLIELLPLSSGTHEAVYRVISHNIQPVLIFTMLWLSFMKVKLRDMKPRRWHLWLLLMQAGCFLVCSVLALLSPTYGTKILFEGAMLAFICPTATASAVITGKLDGSVSGVVTYLMFCNLMVSLLAPAILPLVEPHGGMTFIPSFLMIMRKVFPLLICPLLLAQGVRYLLPKWYRRVMRYPDLAFHIWLPALALAITVTVRSIALSTVDWHYMVGLAVISGVCCMTQFALGKWLGGRYDGGGQAGRDGAVLVAGGGTACNGGDDGGGQAGRDGGYDGGGQAGRNGAGLVAGGQAGRNDGVQPSIRVTAGQAFGQKNTVFVIWLGLVFLDPVTSVVGGFYSVWHNLVNSWQLRKCKLGVRN